MPPWTWMFATNMKASENTEAELAHLGAREQVRTQQEIAQELMLMDSEELDSAWRRLASLLAWRIKVMNHRTIAYVAILGFGLAPEASPNVVLPSTSVPAGRGQLG